MKSFLWGTAAFVPFAADSSLTTPPTPPSQGGERHLPLRLMVDRYNTTQLATASSWQATSNLSSALSPLQQALPTILAAIALVLGFLDLGSAPASAADRPALEYNRDVRPILAENCFACHGPDSAARKADMRLDRRDDAIKAGAIAPGDTESSELIARINAQDPQELMPPPVTTKKLTQDQKQILGRWIAEGAAYQPHWSLIPPKRPARPVVQNEAWIRNPIDLFVLAKLEEKGLRPHPRQTAGRWRAGSRST